MSKHYLLWFVALVVTSACSCYKPRQQEQRHLRYSEPVTTVVTVPTTIKGQVISAFFPAPVGGIKIVARSQKPLYYYYEPYDLDYANPIPEYAESVLDSTYTDSNGYFSMSFIADSFACHYYLSLQGNYIYTAPHFAPGLITDLAIPIYKTVDVRIHLNIIHNNKPRLLVYFQEDDTDRRLGFIGTGDLQLYTHIQVRADTVGYLYYMYIEGNNTGKKSDTVHLSSYQDTATRYFTIDPTMF